MNVLFRFELIARMNLLIANLLTLNVLNYEKQFYHKFRELQGAICYS